MDGTWTSNYEDNMNGEPCAVKVACTVRKGIEREGLVTVPRSQSTLHRPDDTQATRFRRKCIYLIGTPPHIAKETFNCIRTANRAMHHLWKGIKREEMGLIFT